jgi:hypothetical protein
MGNEKASTVDRIAFVISVCSLLIADLIMIHDLFYNDQSLFVINPFT